MKVRLVGLATLFCFICRFAYAQEEISLEQVMALALERNYDIRIAKNVSLSATTDKDYAWAAFLPQLNGVGTVLWNSNQQTLRFQDASRNNSGKAESKNIGASVQLNWLLFDGTKMFATLDRIKAIDAQGQLLVKDQVINTITTVINSYYDIVRQKQQLKATLEQMAVSEERVKLAEKKLQVGTGSKPELLQARVDLNTQRTQVIQQENIIVALKGQLNALLDLQLARNYEVADSIVIDLNLNEEELSANLEQNNFSLLASKMDMEIAQISRRERRAEFSPIISFNGSLNYNQADNITLINPFSALFSQSQGYNYGFTINIPILNAFNTRRLVTQSNIILDRQQLLYSQLKTDIITRMGNSYVLYDNAKRVLLLEEETILLAKENVFIALESFKRGFATAIELRTAQQSLADAYNRLITARYNAKLAETELLRLSGRLLR
jgi:outer membrane protein